VNILNKTQTKPNRYRCANCSFLSIPIPEAAEKVNKEAKQSEIGEKAETQRKSRSIAF
jgi:hypothetical protein